MITDLRLQNFRSYKDSSFELNPGVNIIVGPNASGKTNLIEAILVLATGSSYRAVDKELIKFDKPWARIDGDLNNNTRRTVKIVIAPEPAKSYEIAGKTIKRLSLNNSLPVVLFEPNHLLMLSGGPERRRAYMDDLLAQTEPGYGTIVRQYKRALAQRNRLLKNHHQTTLKEQIFAWDVKLSQLAGQIVRSRSKLAQNIDKKIGKLYKDLSQTKNEVTVSYKSQWKPENYETKLLDKLENTLETDVQRGFTANGPHREDLEVYVDARALQETASRGESRTTLLALKIIELQIIQEVREEAPLLLLDDVFSELDGRRRHALTDYLSSYQTFITTTDADLALKHFNKNSNVIPL